MARPANRWWERQEQQQATAAAPATAGPFDPGACPGLPLALARVAAVMDEWLAAEDPRVFAPIRRFVSRGGKRIRPTLCLLAARAAGGAYAPAVAPAALIELIHNFTLIHDDIEDEAALRRGEPALHALEGVPVALNAGDALYTLVWERLCAGAAVWPAMFARALKQVVVAQGLELAWTAQRPGQVNELSYLQMVRGKTGALLGLACEAGAATARPGLAGPMRRFGEAIGMAFQLRDDVLDLTAHPGGGGKDLFSDIARGKQTLIVIHCLEHAPDGDRQRLARLLGAGGADAAHRQEVLALLEEHGSLAYAQQRALRLAESARAELTALPPSTERELLAALATHVVTRDR